MFIMMNEYFRRMNCDPMALSIARGLYGRNQKEFRPGNPWAVRNPDRTIPSVSLRTVFGSGSAIKVPRKHRMDVGIFGTPGT
jgi:hypothetical protein